MAPPVLIYVPGISKELGSSATRVAEVIAQSQSRQRPGTYSVKLDTVAGQSDGASITAPSGDVVLRVVEADYRTRIAEKPDSSTGFALLRSARFAVLGIIRLLRARRRSKSGRHRWFLIAGFLVVLLLLAAFLAVAITAIVGTGLVDVETTWGLEWIEKATARWPFESGAVAAALGAAALWLRVHLIDGSRAMREQMMYLERGREGASVALEIDETFDRLLDEADPPSAIHILAYSFGSLVTLDALFSRIPRRSGGTDRAAAITSLVTVGCPLDFVRQFYPDYFQDRSARRTDLEWANLFLPEDILGSNFLDGDDVSGYETPPQNGVFRIAGVAPSRSIAVGHEQLTLTSLLSLRGFEVHGEYWDEPERANLLEPVMEMWLAPR